MTEIICLKRLNTPVDVREFQDNLEKKLLQSHWDGSSVFKVREALEEALANAIKHGHENDFTKTVTIEYSISLTEACFTITDEGSGFDPEDVPDPLEAENLERPCGRGLLLMRHYMTEVTYNNKGNAVKMKKTRNLMP